MDRDLPLYWKWHEAYWTPDLANSFGGKSLKLPGTGASRREKKAGGLCVRIWQGLRWYWASVSEFALLLLAIAFAAAPQIYPGFLTRCGRYCFKRAFDVIGATVGLILALPIFLIVPVLIKLDSPGPVFYRQTRVGLDRRRGSRRVLGLADAPDRRLRDRRQLNQWGRTFKLLKFRSMIHNAERGCGPVWASRNDPRVTRLGAFLRRSRIDEVPQLLNVLLGHMSLVGPRPERPHFVSRFCDSISNYTFRHSVKPGITGLAQVEHGYDRDELDVQRKVEYDLQYIHGWKPALDMKILLKTVRVVVTGRGSQ